jgi:DNA-directed RNA polymerase subunit N (RpoN/RPB10)
MADAVEEKPLQVTSSLRRAKCPYCGGRMLASRRNILSGMTHMYWQKPWGQSLRMDEPIVPMACVSCGAVLFALRDSARVSREWQALSEADKRRVDEDG